MHKLDGKISITSKKRKNEAWLNFCFFFVFALLKLKFHADIMLFFTLQTFIHCFLAEIAMVFTLPLSFAMQLREICTIWLIDANKRPFIAKQLINPNSKCFDNFTSTVKNSAVNGQFPLWNLCAGNRGSCIQNLGLMNTTTMIPCRHISQRERVIV